MIISPIIGNFNRYVASFFEHGAAVTKYVIGLIDLSMS